MSKQEMARKLIELGCDKAFNTLRKYSVETLEGLLTANMKATTPLIELPPVVEDAPKDVVKTPEASTIAPETVKPIYVPTDAELYQAAKPVSAPVAAQAGTLAAFVALALTPFALLRGIVGV